MTTNFDLLILTDRTLIFYAALGPFFSNPDVEREIGVPLRHESMKTWVAAVRYGEPVGCSAIFRNLHNPAMPCEFGSAYVLREWRKKGIYTALVEKRLELAEGREVVCNARGGAREILKRWGFKERYSRQDPTSEHMPMIRPRHLAFGEVQQ